MEVYDFTNDVIPALSINICVYATQNFVYMGFIHHGLSGVYTSQDVYTICIEVLSSPYIRVSLCQQWQNKDIGSINQSINQSILTWAKLKCSQTEVFSSCKGISVLITIYTIWYVHPFVVLSLMSVQWNGEYFSLLCKNMYWEYPVIYIAA